LHPLETAFRNHVRALPVVAAIEHHEDVPRFRCSQAAATDHPGVRARASRARRWARRNRRPSGRPVRARIERRPSAPTTRSAVISNGPCGVFGLDAGDSPGVLDQTGHFGLHDETERGKSAWPRRR
jgi:hypothetical protein